MTVFDALKYVPLIGEAKQAIDSAFEEQHLPQSFCPQVRVDATGPVTMPQRPPSRRRFMRLLDEEACRSWYRNPTFLPFDHTGLVPEVCRRPEGYAGTDEGVAGANTRSTPCVRSPPGQLRIADLFKLVDRHVFLV